MGEEALCLCIFFIFSRAWRYQWDIFLLFLQFSKSLFDMVGEASVVSSLLLYIEFKLVCTPLSSGSLCELT